MDQLASLNFGLNTELSPETLLINLCIAAVLSVVLRWFYSKFGRSLNDKATFANIFPLIILTTCIIISLIKSSFALSLGLIGALSIVRFRTPIKDPEELAYLFFAIAIGLGLGANQQIITVLGTVVTLLLVAIIRWQFKAKEEKGIYLSIKSSKKESANEFVDRVSKKIQENAPACDLRRLDVGEDKSIAMTLLINLSGDQSISTITSVLDSESDISYCIIDQNQLPAV